MASDESELLYLRPEAQPIEQWDRLTEYQKKGLEHLLNMLREAVGKNAGDDNQPRQKRLPWLFAETKTRLAFINGFRGTGKTTLMTTLVGAIDEPEAIKEGQPGDDIEQGRFKAVKQLAADLHNQVIPVQPLDMEGLPPNTPLLAAILARVYRAAQDYTQDFDAPRGLLVDDPADNREARRLKMFQQRVAKALDSNLRVRMGNLDPDQFAEAVMAEEDNRLGMVRDLEQVLSDLSKTLREQLKRSSRGKTPDGKLLFVVPIDDVDLNPLRCLELLRLLRTFSPPRELFFLLMGQYDLVESIFKLQIAADFGKVHKEGDGLLTLSKKTLQNDLAAVSAANVRKMIPPHARVDLPKLSLADVLEFRPLGLRNSTDARTQGDSQAGKSAPLEELFRRIPLWTKEGKTCRFPTLAALVAGSREEPAAFTALRNVVSACDFNWAQYCGLGMYQVHARRLADVWIELRHMRETLPPSNDTGYKAATSDAARSIQELLSKHWARAVDADPHLSADERRRLEKEGLGRCTRFPDDEPAYERDLEIADAAIEVKFDNDNYPATTYHPRLRFTALWPGSGVPQFDLRVAARPHATDEVSSSTPGAIPVESEATRCSGVLRHDLMELFNAETQTMGEFPELTSERPVLLSWVGSEGEVAAYPWPIPPLPTFVETSRFLNDWWAIQNTVLNSSEPSGVAHPNPELSSGVSSGKGTKNATSTTNSSDESATIPAEKVERLALQWAVLGLAAVEESLTGSLPAAEAASPLRQPNVNWKELAERFFVLRNSAKSANHLRGWGQLDKWLRRTAQLVQPEICSPKVSLELTRQIESHDQSSQDDSSVVAGPLQRLHKETRGILDFQRRERLSALWTNGKRELWRGLNYDAIAKLAGGAEPQWLVERIPEPQSDKSDDREELRNLKSTVDQFRREQWQSKITDRQQILEILARVDKKAAEQQYQTLRRDLALSKRDNPTDLWILARVTEIAIMHAGILESLGRPKDALEAFQNARDAGKEEFDANGPLTKDPHEFWIAAKTLAEFHQRKQRKPKAVEACRQWLASTDGFYARQDPDDLTDSNLIDRAEAQWLVIKNLPVKHSDRKNLAAAVISTIESLQKRRAELSPLLRDAKRELVPPKPNIK